MDKFVMYRRVSTSEQGSSGLGLKAQSNAIRACVELQQGELIDSYQDIQSGSKNNREGLHKALRSCRVHNAALVVSKLCRLSRSFSHSAHLLEGNIPILVAENPRASMLELRLKAAINQEERERISMRTKEALRVKISRGETVGNPEIWRYAKNQSTTEANRARSQKSLDFKLHIREIIEKRYGENLPSLATMADWLNNNGHKTPRGKKFTKAAVRRILSP